MPKQPDLAPKEAADLRDQFAMTALGALVKRLDWAQLNGAEKRSEVADLAYRFADAMMGARDKP
jgi:hypothetical protein